MKISLCLIATNRYNELVSGLLVSLEMYFLTDHDITIHLFTDDDDVTYRIGRLKIIKYKIPSYGFPDATLLRYKIMTTLPITDYGDYIFYLDVDMRIVAAVEDKILCDLLAVKHPGYYNGGGSWETNIDSNCFVPVEKRKTYYAGGFQGGKTEVFYDAAQLMALWIFNDANNGIIPVWHDESAWNRLLCDRSAYMQNTNVKILTPKYCMPEPIEKRIAWGINHFEPKILALEKPENFRL